MQKTAAIIVTYNAVRHNWVRKCLDSLIRSDTPLDIFVVDNASSDETCNIIRKEYPSVKLVESKENLGFGGANNLGLEMALNNGSNFFFLLNQDAWIETDTVKRLVEQLQKNPEYGLMSPLHLSGDGSKLDWHFISSASFSKCPGLTSDFVLGFDTDKVYETQNVCAAAWLLSKECLKSVGGFNPSFFHYAEDDNYIHRMHYKGLKAGIYPKVKMYHDRESRKEDPKYSNKEFQLNNFYLLEVLNPNKKYNTQNLIRELQINGLKSLLSGNKKDFILKRKQARKFRNDKGFNEGNFKTSVEKEYAFLNFSE